MPTRQSLSFLILWVSTVILLPFANVSAVIEEESTLVEQHVLGSGRAKQGLALAENEYYGVTSTTLYRFDTNWNLLESKVISIPLVNHMGAIDYHDGYIWAGFLNGPNLTRQSIIAKIRASDFEIVDTWNITDDVTWIDPVCFDGEHLWVGDMSDLGIHRYALVGGELVRDGIFRYPGAMSFSQGVRIVGDKLYTIHTFGSMDGLYEFDIPDPLTEAENQPTRHWVIKESTMHLEGFDFIPGHPGQIWESQSSQVDRYELGGLGQWKFMVSCDSRDSGSVGVTTSILNEIVDEAINQDVELVIFPGDLVSGSSDPAVLTAQLSLWKSVMQPLYDDANISVYPIRGNHEVAGVVGPTSAADVWNTQFAGQYANPNNGPAGEENMTFSFIYRDAFFVGLGQYDGANDDLNYNKVNQAWLNGQLAGNIKPHVFTFGHEPAFAALHSDCLDDSVSDRDAFWQSLKNAGSRAYFCGHDHFYDRAHVDDNDGDPNNDIRQYIVGSAGAPLYSFGGSYSGDNSGMTITQEHCASKYGYVIGEVDELNVTLTWWQRTSNDPCAAGVYTAADTWSYTVELTHPKASNPKPENYETDVEPTTVVLKWDPGDDVNTHDVYLGTNEQNVTDANSTITLNVFKGNVDTNSYDPCNLEYDKTYYWRIDEVNEAQTWKWKGPVWNFTTRRPKATDQYPTEQSTSVAVNVVLHWTADAAVDDTNGHHVYFGTNYNDVDNANTSSALYMGAQDGNSYDPAGSLSVLVPFYYWRVDEVNDSNVYKGTVCSFSCAAPVKMYTAADTHIHAGYGAIAERDTNYGGGTFNSVCIPQPEIHFCRFNISDIPSGKEVISARLHQWWSDNWTCGPMTFSAHDLLTDFSEMTTTWNNYAGGTGGIAGTDYVAAAAYTVAFDAGTEVELTMDVTNLVKDWYDGSSTVAGIYLKATSGSNGKTIVSREGQASKRPYIEVIYTETYHAGRPQPLENRE